MINIEIFTKIKLLIHSDYVCVCVIICRFKLYICMGAEKFKNEKRDYKWDENANLIFFSTQTLAGVLADEN